MIPHTAKRIVVPLIQILVQAIANVVHTDTEDTSQKGNRGD